MQETKNSRLYVLDLFKLLASYFVVFIHCQFSGDWGIAVKAVARFAVPFFFLCSGYFLYGNKPEKILRKASRIFRLFCSSFLIFFVYQILINYTRGNVAYVLTWLRGLANFKGLIKLIFFNVPYVSTHLWFLSALTYVYLIHYWLAKKHLSDVFIGLSSVILLILHLIIWQAVLTLNTTSQTFIVRNFLFTGYPFVGIGMLIRKHSNKLPKLTPLKAFVLILLGSMTSVLSRFALGDKSVPGGAIITAVTLLIYALQHDQRTSPTLGRNAGKYSTFIFVFHPIAIDLVGYLSKAAGKDSASVVWINVKPVLVCIITTFFAGIFYFLTGQYKNCKSESLNNFAKH